MLWTALLNGAAASGGSVVNGGLGGPGAAQANTAGAQPGLGDPPNSVLGGKGQAGGGLGGLLEQLAAAAAGASAGSSPGATAPASGGGLDTLIRGLADAVSGTTTASKAGAGGSSADALKQSFQKLGEPKVAPTPQQDAAAGLMLRAMLQAAKCDGKIDEEEKKKLIEALGDASPDEVAFVNGNFPPPSTYRVSSSRCRRGSRSRSTPSRSWPLTSTARRRRNIWANSPQPWA